LWPLFTRAVMIESGFDDPPWLVHVGVTSIGALPTVRTALS
jgi:hypothetical protein